MKIKIKLIIPFVVVLSIIFANSVLFGAGSSDDEDENYVEVIDENYINGKEQAYNGKQEEAIVYLKKSIENDSKNADACNMLGYSNRKLGKNEEAFKY